MADPLAPEPPRPVLDSPLLPDFLLDAEHGLARLEASLSGLEGDAAGRAIEALRQALHTLKGGATLVGDAELAQYIHAQELWLAGQSTPPEASAVRARIAPVQRRLERLRAQAHGRGMRPTGPNGPAPLEVLAERLHETAQQAAQATGKLVALGVHGNGVYFEPETLARLAPALEHLLRNAVAHGLEPPSERRRLGKGETGRVVVEAVQGRATRNVHVSDDGAGIDAVALATQAGRLGLPVPTRLIDLLCLPGVSSAARQDLSAGLGLGLAAVQAIVTELGGELDVDTVVGQGTRFTLRLP